MSTEDAERWYRKWQQRRQRCLDVDVSALRDSLPPEAIAIVDDVRRLAAVDDHEVHAAADVDAVLERVNALDWELSVQLHGPVSNALSNLVIAAQELLSARVGPGEPAVRPVTSFGRRPRTGFEWLLVVGEDEELRELVADCERRLAGERRVRTAETADAASEVLKSRREGSALVVANLTLRSADGTGPHGLRVAREARHRRHAALVVTAARDYFNYSTQLLDAGLTGHDVIVKTRRDFASRLRARISEIAEPSPVPISYDEDSGHVVRVGGVEVSGLEAQEALVLSKLSDTWRTAGAIADRCAHTELGPKPGNVPPLISALRRELAKTLLLAESVIAQGEVIETLRRDGMPAQYRLAPWLRWVPPPPPRGAASTVPPVLVVEDQEEWADWALGCLEELQWPASAARTVEEAWTKLEGTRTPIVVADLGLPEPVTGRPDIEVGLRLIEEVLERHPGARMIVLSAYGSRDSLRSRLFEAGVRMMDVIDKAANRDERRAMLMTSVQRAADEMWRGVRRAMERHPVHRLVRLAPDRIEVDGGAVERLTPGEAEVVELLISHANQPVTAEHIEDRCYPHGFGRPGAGRKDLNRVHQTFKRLRQKIDQAVGADGVGAAVICTPHRGALTTYELGGVVIDRVERRPASGSDLQLGSSAEGPGAAERT
jgi:DNA-binding response OmpR family regulator